ncbi:hypothetical protein PLICRDRAFT_442485 [Plicaturopsis crispa FD-325 SS-3]|uniref:Uncharacterized protein n=1 Tax=Plicaturopsis crispa FD-325 SS-3 TaxID=944288 RepID=A0A0C9T6T3_PLICR|nr:hypothetical protein PLICRDRAFT_442485 [Plicaturopsis crispa FD-325 SS-3]
MASSPATLPPLDKINIISIWTGTVLFGINLVLYSVCLFVLKRGRAHRSSWVLGATSTLLLVLATAHISISLKQLVEAFVDIPKLGEPQGSILYWTVNTNPAEVTKTYIYVIIGWIQDCILTWRMYVVYGRNWKLCLLPLVIVNAQIGSALFSAFQLSRPGADITSTAVRSSAFAGWSLDLAINVGITLAIAGRLWYMGRSVARAMSSHLPRPPNKYDSAIFTVIESGALFTTATIVILVLYCSDTAVALSFIDVATQLAATTPLLIVVRVGLGLTHGLPRQAGGGKTARMDNSDYRPAINVASSRGVEVNVIHDIVTDGGEDGYSLNDLKPGRKMSSHSDV